MEKTKPNFLKRTKKQRNRRKGMWNEAEIRVSGFSRLNVHSSGDAASGPLRSNSADVTDIRLLCRLLSILNPTSFCR